MTSMSANFVRDLLERWVTNLPPKVYNGRLSPSQLGGCHRAHYYRINGVPATTPPSTGALLNFQIGFLWEQNIKQALDASGIPYEFQTELESKEHNLGGSSDFIVDNKFMVDAKTQRSEWFWYREKSRKEGNYEWWKENYQYIIQQGAYLLLCELLGKPLDYSILAFISKDDGIVGEELKVYLNDKVRAEVVGRISYMNDCIKAGVLPKCECDGWKLGYCDYGDPSSQIRNRKGKMVNTACCSEDLILMKGGNIAHSQ